MCGRVLVLVGIHELIRALLIDDVSPLAPALPIDVVAPSEALPAVIQDAQGRRRLGALRFGMRVPFKQGLLLHARGETAAAKPLFREALARRRAIIPATGFIEWGPGPAGPKTAYRVMREDGGVMALAALFEPRSPDGLSGAVIVTRAATGALAAIHERVPVVLDPEAIGPWLQAGERGADVLAEALDERSAATRLAGAALRAVPAASRSDR